MKKTFNKTLIILLAVFLLLPLSVWAIDFGFVTNISTGFGNNASDDVNFDFKIDLWPRLSLLIGDNGDFLFSAGLTLGVDEEFFYVPEILHTEFSMRFGSSGIRVGRINYSDPLSFVAEGLFDGALFYHNSGIGVFQIGAWYTGFLYKKNANITMTDDDLMSFGTPLDYGDFFGTYFAPSRMIASLGWEHPSVAEVVNLRTAVVAQVDLTDSDSKFHSQYLIVKGGFPFSIFLIEFGGSFGMSQTINDDNEFNLAFAGEAGFFWLFPSEFNSRLSFIARIAGGKIENSVDAFVPITTKYYGFILKHKLSGLSVLSVNFSSRINQDLGTSVDFSYFIRNDLGTFKGYPVSPDSEGFFLGPEVSAQATWSPFSDLQLNLGGGLFIPALGNAGSKENINWRIELSATMSIF
ncbi:MAG: hypothetical protein FWD24_00245 [Treponema sp.]|nr:hypothetical protein [Treponema sp.]